MSKILNIICIDCFYAKALQNMGHNVFSPTLEPSCLQVMPIVASAGFEPDLFIQQERLGLRVFFDGLA